MVRFLRTGTHPHFFLQAQALLARGTAGTTSGGKAHKQAGSVGITHGAEGRPEVPRDAGERFAVPG